MGVQIEKYPLNFNIKRTHEFVINKIKAVWQKPRV